jgi:hypothetical protein
MVARRVPQYPKTLKHLRHTHREQVPDRTQAPVLPLPRADKRNERVGYGDERLIRIGRGVWALT